ncbi:hypothetical protein [Burkholderia cepacia]|uniref:hypothetical protein n=1 Tax=Burkholderia cepacia TaxID=292 RepID=UPI000ABFF9DD|nr:hypothetical protein [Burkholderia cepacia]
MLLFIEKFAGFSENRVHYKARTQKGKPAHLIYELDPDELDTAILATHFCVDDPGDIDEEIARSLERHFLESYKLFDTPKEAVYTPNLWHRPYQDHDDIHSVFQTCPSHRPRDEKRGDRSRTARRAD